MSYVALGDSFTAGTGCEPGECWADRLAARLGRGRTDFTYRNFAVDGARSEAVAGQVEPAIALSPEVVTVVCGANDVLFAVRADLDVYEQRLVGIFRRLREALPEVRLATATAPERWDFLQRRPRTRERFARGIVGLNEVTRRVAADHEIPCLDIALHPGVADPASFHADGLHPSALAHSRLAHGFELILGAAAAPEVAAQWAAQ